MTTLDKEISQIEALTELRQIRDKRASRKGQLTRLTTQIQTLLRNPIRKQRLGELQKKLEEASRSSQLFDVLQTRYEEVAATTNHDIAAESELGNQIRTDNDHLVNLVEVAIEKIELFQRGKAILSRLSSLLEAKSISTTYLTAELDKLSEAIGKYQAEFEVYDDDEDLHGLSQKLKSTHRAAVELVKDPRPSADTAVKDTTPTVHKDRFKLKPPTFDGQPLEWKRFSRLFQTIIAKDPTLEEAEKACILMNAMTTPEAREVVRVASDCEYGFKEAMEALRQKYGKERVIYREHLNALTIDRTFGHNKEDLNFIYDHWTTHIRGLKDCGAYEASNILATMLEEKFRDDLKQEWNHSGLDSEKPTSLEKLLEFIKTRANSDLIPSQSQAAATSQVVTAQKKAKPPASRADNRRDSVQKQFTPPVYKCSACKQEGHTLSRCDTFQSWDVNKRNQFIRDHKFCLNCFSNKHLIRDCKSTYACRTCGSKHHTLLHRDTTAGSETTQAAPLMNITHKASYLTTAIAMVSHGVFRQKARVLLDGGAAVSVITEDLATRLKAKRHPCNQSLNFGPFPTVSKSYIRVHLSSPHQEGGAFTTIEAYVTPKLPPSIPPPNATELLKLPFIKGKSPIADPQLGGEIEILLSITDSGDCIIGGTTQYKEPTTTLTQTIFGWALGGAAPGEPRPQEAVLTVQPHDNSLDECLQRLWQMEQVSPSVKQIFSDDDQTAVEHFLSTHQVLEDGRYAVQLPRKSPVLELGESRPAAIRRYIQNEKTLEGKGQLQEFHSVLKEYLTLGHAEKVPLSERTISPSKSFYLPVHGVTKESSTTTKLRAVFDTSAKTKSGVSLNDQLLGGPNLYPLLTTVLNRFRIHRIAITSDISKMFREVELQPSERDFHRFILRENGELTDCRMKRLTFGVKSSPFLATQVLRQLAETNSTLYPLAATAIKEAFYVDDCLVGAATVQEAEILRKQLCDLLSSAGMKLRKWRSNSPVFLETIPEELQEKADLDIHDPLSSSKALGIHWDVKNDKLHISVPHIANDQPATKRTIASITAKVFDVLGFFAPAVLPAKILLQKLWSLRLDWDAKVPEDIESQWKEWTSQLHLIANHPIDRPFNTHKSKVMSYQLHGFSDASSQAYGGVVYLRTTFEDTQVIVTLVTSKSRVAPLQTVTIPKLELTAALLTSKLLDSVASDLNIPQSNLHAWTDSTITLCWLKKPPNTLKTFVANRVSQIQELVPSSQWRHVPTKDNPADISSRGTDPGTLVKSDLWWNGPPWLSSSPINWPSIPSPSLPDDLPEVKPLPVMTVVTVPPQDNSLWHRYSSFTKLTRILAWCKRFIRNCVDKQQLSPILTPEEINHIKQCLLRYSQQETYGDIIQLVRNGKSIPKSNPLFKYNLHISDDGTLLIKSRVRDDLNSSQPRLYIVLSLQSHLVKLFIRTLHQDLNHPGTSTLLATLAETYYIAGVKTFLKGVSRTCVQCQKAYMKTTQQQMGMLPSDRTRPSPPFDKVGIDFAGPFTVRRGNPRKPTRVKVYACVFVCMATRAVHLELCSDLSTEAFIAALQRFGGRRGIPSHIYSDHGTNFVGARNEMAELHELLKSKTTQERISRWSPTNYIQWHFIPSRAPHFGGLWESGVRAMKVILRKNLAPHLLTFEELSTVLVQAEAILNSRPLIPLDSTEANGPTSLTAGHFLIGRPLIAPPSRENTDIKISLLTRWNLVERLNTDLWIQWRTRYLQSLQARSKWQKPSRNYQIGDIVILKDDTLIQRTWPLARIIKIYPGDDGLVRTVDVFCNGRTYNRATNRLVLLIPDQPSSPAPVCPGPPGQQPN